ncbi:MAG: hypothetical protein M3046_10770 [Actinomycetota bacterium]|nr:hypothetical protein [Actinomycetota bacterium]
MAGLATLGRRRLLGPGADHYQTIASAVAHGHGIAASFPFDYRHVTAFRPTLYPAVLGGMYRITGVRVGAGQLLNIAFGAAVVAVYPPLLANDVVLLSEPLSLALMLAMLLLLVRGRRAWAGLTCGLLVLTRSSAQLLVVALGAWVVWRFGWRRRDRGCRAVGRAQRAPDRLAHPGDVERVQPRVCTRARRRPPEASRTPCSTRGSGT